VNSKISQSQTKAKSSFLIARKSAELGLQDHVKKENNICVEGGV
jgi:hypothetical protein